MANFSSFFPVAAAGGGGFTKMKKYVTTRSLNDATDKIPGPGLVEGVTTSAISGGGQTSFGWKLDNTPADQIAAASTVDGLVGYTFNIGYGVQTVTGNTGGGFLAGQTLSFTPAVAGGVPANSQVHLTGPTSFTVNPATDLGLSDGDSIGYMLVGAGYSGQNGNYGGKGGKIIQGTAIITTASTNLVLTPGVANGGNSTITGGLTLSSGDGSNMAGGADFNNPSIAAGSGIMGYGAGGGANNAAARMKGELYHGWGGGSYYHNEAGDGAILLFY